MNLKTQMPVTVLFRCDVRDTAILVGLVQSRISIGTIAYTGTIEKENMDYLRVINSWLESKGQTKILIHPYLSFEQLERVLQSPLPEWGWSDEECKAAIKLAGLPLPEFGNK